MSGVVDVLLFGDSITFAWPNPTPATRRHAGIPGETAVAMVARFAADAIRPGPRIVHIMAGTNDVAENDGAYDEADTVRAIAAMAGAAVRSGVAVLLAAVPPAGTIPWRPEIEAVPRIASLNRAIARLGADRGLRVVDYGSALADGRGGMRPGLSTDGLHPNAAGYAVMEPVLAAALSAR